jgi:hypothetical protein
MEEEGGREEDELTLIDINQFPCSFFTITVIYCIIDTHVLLVGLVMLYRK